MSLTYEVNASFSPNEGRRGERAMLQVEYSNIGANAVIDKSVVRISEYGIYDVMKREEDGKFTWSYPIPYEAPVQTYAIEVYAIDTQGNKGPTKIVRFAVHA